jgi:hypothetical protein
MNETLLNGLPVMLIEVVTCAVNMNALSRMAAQDLEGGTVSGSLCPTRKGAGTTTEVALHYPVDD